jgi:uncharacterized protein involved in exopolysaccharide biosynthesis
MTVPVNPDAVPGAALRWRMAGGALLVVGTSALLAGGWLVFSTDVYLARALVALPAATKPSPWSFQTELARMQSRPLLGAVVERLELVRRWEDERAVGLTREQAVDLLRRQFAVRQYRSTSLIEIRVRSSEPQEAAELANGIASVYVEIRREAEQRGRPRMPDLLRSDLVRQNTLVSNLQSRVEVLHQELGGVDAAKLLAQPHSAEEAKALAQAEELARLDSELLFAEAAFEDWKGMDQQRLREELPLALPNEVILPGLLADRAEAEEALDGMAGETAADEEALARAAQQRADLDEQIEARLNTLLAEMQHQVAALRLQRAQLQQQLSQAASPTMLLPSRQVAALAQLTRDLEAKKKLRDELQLRLAREEIESASRRDTHSAVEIIDRAEPPARPGFPNRVLGGELLGGGGVLATAGFWLWRPRKPRPTWSFASTGGPGPG